MSVDSKESAIPGLAGGIDDERQSGLGLLSRFLGGVFLVLVCGLLLLDHALLQANHDQTSLDAQAASLLTEGFVTEHTALLERLGALATWVPGRMPVVPRDLIAELRHKEEVRGAWVRDAAGRTTVITRTDSLSVISAAIRDERQGIILISSRGHVTRIEQRYQVKDTAGNVIGTAGLLI